MEPRHRDGRRRHRLDAPAERPRSVAPVHDLLRARRDAFAAPSHTGVDQEDQRHASVRQGLRGGARADLRQPEEARRDSAGDAKLTPWPKDLLKSWDQHTPEEKKLLIKQADVYGAYLAYVDYEIGRVVQTV